MVGKHIQDDVVSQIAAYSFCQSSELVLEIVRVQQQMNGVDCGLFAIAFATSISSGAYPVNTVYGTKEMRPHINCIENEELTLFPEVKGKRTLLCKPAKHLVELFCSCRRPWFRYTEEDDMVECNSCKEWFHQKCENIPDSVFNIRKKVWKCRSCRRHNVKR